ncbi:hypothetical protein SN11_16925 [Vibrio harveyi]|nr:hypothetical protein SN11_16925 [Vibrio harveyi]
MKNILVQREKLKPDFSYSVNMKKAELSFYGARATKKSDYEILFGTMLKHASHEVILNDGLVTLFDRYRRPICSHATTYDGVTLTVLVWVWRFKRGKVAILCR